MMVSPWLALQPAAVQQGQHGAHQLPQWLLCVAVIEERRRQLGGGSSAGCVRLACQCHMCSTKAYLADIWDARQLVIRGQTADAGAGPHGLMATGTAP
jgi:hypothetical protein